MNTTPLRYAVADPAALSDPRLTGFTHRYANVEGVRMHYVMGGDAAGETLVLLAGFPQSWYAWRKVMSMLATSYRIIALDLPAGVTPIGLKQAMTPVRWRKKYTAC